MLVIFVYCLGGPLGDGWMDLDEWMMWHDMDEWMNGQCGPYNMGG